jgi:nitrite reductase (NADH) large subunit
LASTVGKEAASVSEPLVIVGKGMAATRLVEELGKRALGRYAIAVVGAEPRPAYNRVLLSSLLAGDIAAHELELKSLDWWRGRGVTTLYGTPVSAIDRARARVTLADGTSLAYAKLVLATGSQPIRLPLPGADLAGVMTFRDHADVDGMKAAARRGARAVVIGGGLLGIEAAYGLARAGARVGLVHLMDRLMDRQLDAHAAQLLKQAIEARGIEVILAAETKTIGGSERAETVELTDGRVLPADLVVVAAGIRPNIDLARGAGLSANRGIIVDDGLATSDAAVAAIGECAEHRGVAYGLVEPAYEQARVLAARLAGDAGAHYAGSVVATNLKVSGVNVFSAGEFMRTGGTETVTLHDAATPAYRKLVLADDRLIGAVLYGETGDALWFLDLIKRRVAIGALRDTVLFGRAFTERKAA